MHKLAAANRAANNPGVLIPDRPIAFNRDFVNLGIGVKAALFLSQALYWSKRTKDIDGWFYKVVAEWEEETGLTTEEQRGVKKVLIDREYIEVEKRGIPARNHFKVNTDTVAYDLLDVSIQQDQCCENNGTSDGEETEHTYTESTQRKHTGKTKVLHKEEIRIVIDGEEDDKPKKTKSKCYVVFDVFKDVVGKAPLNWHKNVTQRTCAENLYKERGLDQIRKALEFYVEYRDNKFCPVVDSPYDLDSKWSKLSKFKNKNE